MYKISTAAVGLAVLLSAVPAFAMTGTSTMMHAGKSVDIACVQTAVDMREGAIGTAYGTYTTAMSTALSTRKSALHDAWGMSDATARKAARKAAWTAFSTASHDATKALKSARSSAWSTFETAAKACGAGGVESRTQDGVGSIGL